MLRAAHTAARHAADALESERVATFISGVIFLFIVHVVEVFFIAPETGDGPDPVIQAILLLHDEQPRLFPIAARRRFRGFEPFANLFPALFA